MVGTKRPNILPGFGLSLGFAVFFLSLILLLPVTALFLKTATANWSQLSAILFSRRLAASLRLSFGAAFFAALANAFIGLMLAWVLTRYHFPGKRIWDALIDLPFAMPTAVAGIALTTIYAPGGLIGKYAALCGVKIAFTPLGVWLALVFVGIPFVVRTLQPVIRDLDSEIEEAAASLGANRLQTFRRVILPLLIPGWLTGFGLAFARGLGEYGSVVFISGNLPLRTEITPFLIVSKLEQYDYLGAAVIAVLLMGSALLLLFMINSLQRWYQKNHAI